MAFPVSILTCVGIDFFHDFKHGDLTINQYFLYRRFFGDVLFVFPVQLCQPQIFLFIHLTVKTLCCIAPKASSFNLQLTM